MVRQFFDALSAAIEHQGNQKNYERASKLLKQLAKGIESLSDIPGPGWIAKPISFFVGLFKQEYEKKAQEAESLDYIKDEVSEALAEGKRRVIIVMDDLDRLSAAEEIKNVFQVVKAIADFQHVTYVLAFDDRVVAKALRGVQKQPGGRYLEKIINAPIRVPPISPSKMRDLTLTTLNNFVSAHAGYRWDRVNRAEAVAAFIRTHSRTMRHPGAIRERAYVTFDRSTARSTDLTFLASRHSAYFSRSFMANSR